MGQEYEQRGFRGSTENVHFFGKLALKTDLPGEFLWCQRSGCLGKRHRDAVFEMPCQQALPISYRLLDQIGKTLDFSYCFWQGELYENHHPLGNKSKLDSFSMSLKFKMKICWFRNGDMGLPWWRSGWGSACRCRGRGFEPWFGRIPRAGEQLGPWATNTEPARLEPVLRSGRGRDG